MHGVSGVGFAAGVGARETYFDSCTSWTNLPHPYDDCPTAGWFDPSGARNFGIGSFDKSYIGAHTLYRGRWWFGGGYRASTSVNVTWQEVTTQICADRFDLWCYNGIDGSSLLSTSWRYLQSSFAEWDYSSRWGRRWGVCAGPAGPDAHAGIRLMEE